MSTVTISSVFIFVFLSCVQQAIKMEFYDFNKFSGFVEMMSAYMPDFATIETDKVYQWIVDLENEMSNKKKNVAHTNEIK